MGGWKEDLKKIKQELSTNNVLNQNKKKIKTPETSKQIDEKSCRKGVKPSKKVSKNKAKKKTRNFKKKPSGGKNNLPSSKVIRNTYGAETKPRRTNPSQTKSKSCLLPKFEKFPQVHLTRESEYKSPDNWVVDGTRIQPPGGGQGRALSVRIGIDFGTSYTKVAVRAADQVFFIDWNGIRNSEKQYFLPGEISIRADGSACLGRPSDATKIFGSLKVPFLTISQDANQTYNAVIIFLAEVMRYARSWLYHHQAHLVKSRRLAWEINIGSPTDPWTKSELVDRYKHVGQYAWQLSQITKKITLETADAIVKNTPDDFVADGLDDFHVIPEFVAQLAGHVKSKQRKNGLHLLVDVGAGTLDIASFNIYKKSDEENIRFPIFSGSVELLGTHVLMASRLSLLNLSVYCWNDQEGVPSIEKISQGSGIDKTNLMEMDKEFEELVSKKIRNILGRTKGNRYPQAPEWNTGMRVFLAGGGSYCLLYKNGIDKAFGSIGAKPIFTGFPIHEDVMKIMDSTDFHRVSVAFGLTYDAESIGSIIQQREIDDLLPPSRIIERPDRDELYPK